MCVLIVEAPTDRDISRAVPLTAGSWELLDDAVVSWPSSIPARNSETLATAAIKVTFLRVPSFMVLATSKGLSLRRLNSGCNQAQPVEMGNRLL